MPDDYAASTVTVAVGGSTVGSIETTDDPDWFALTLTAGLTYRFDLQGSATGQGTLLYPVPKLVDSAGQVLLIDSSSGGYGPGPGSNALLLYAATTSDTYYLASDPGNNDTGTHKISATIEFTDVNTGPTAVDDAVSVKEDTTPNPVFGNVLTNDLDANGDPLSVTFWPVRSRTTTDSSSGLFERCPEDDEVAEVVVAGLAGILMPSANKILQNLSRKLCDNHAGANCRANYHLRRHTQPI